MRLNVPSFSRAGPMRISSSVPFWVVATRAPRGSVGWNVAMPQWKPRPGASWAGAAPTAPEEPGPGSLGGGDGGGADHDRVGAAGDRLGDVAAVAHAAVGDH